MKTKRTKKKSEAHSYPVSSISAKVILEKTRFCVWDPVIASFWKLPVTISKPLKIIILEKCFLWKSVLFPISSYYWQSSPNLFHKRGKKMKLPSPLHPTKLQNSASQKPHSRFQLNLNHDQCETLSLGRIKLFLLPACIHTLTHNYIALGFLLRNFILFLLFLQNMQCSSLPSPLARLGGLIRAKFAVSAILNEWVKTITKLYGLLFKVQTSSGKMKKESSNNLFCSSYLILRINCILMMAFPVGFKLLFHMKGYWKVQNLEIRLKKYIFFKITSTRRSVLKHFLLVYLTVTTKHISAQNNTQRKVLNKINLTYQEGCKCFLGWMRFWSSEAKANPRAQE